MGCRFGTRRVIYIKHCHHPNRRMKKHAADLTPYPTELIPFKPIRGPDTEYSQFYNAIEPHPFKAAGIDGFLPPKPFILPTKFLTVESDNTFHWPTLSELNNNLEEFPWQSDKERRQYFADKLPFCPPAMYTGPPPESPSVPQPNEPSAPQISLLAPLIISSADKLFFISHAISNDHCE